MFLRVSSQRVAARTRWTATLFTRPLSAAPAPAASPPKPSSVLDLVIQLTIVDPSGARRKVTGLIGRSLYETCEMHNIHLGPVSQGAAPEIQRTEDWIEPTFGEGATSGFDHVVLVGKGSDTAARMTYIEEQMLDDHWDFDEIFAGSRLASAITLTKEMDGMSVFVPDRIVDNIP